MRVHVISEPDPCGNAIPRCIFMDERRIAVDEILDRWPGANHCYFKVKGEDANIYILRFDERQAAWDLTMYQSPRAPVASTQAGES